MEARWGDVGTPGESGSDGARLASAAEQEVGSRVAQLGVETRTCEKSIRSCQTLTHDRSSLAMEVEEQEVGSSKFSGGVHQSAGPGGQ